MAYEIFSKDYSINKSKPIALQHGRNLPTPACNQQRKDGNKTWRTQRLSGANDYCTTTDNMVLD